MPLPTSVGGAVLAGLIDTRAERFLKVCQFLDSRPWHCNWAVEEFRVDQLSQCFA
jgi:hypothetical protein